MRIFLQKASSYYQAGKLLHWIAILFALITLAIARRLFINHYSISGEIALLFAVSFFFTNSILAELDARSRYQNYKQIKDHLYLNGYHERILRPMLKSMCQRDAALVAANELGMGKICALYFRNHGYRWYHLIPDFMFDQPLFLFSKYFWTSTFMVPTYQPKVNFYSSTYDRYERRNTFLAKGNSR
jgi:hypothetical protein